MPIPCLFDMLSSAGESKWTHVILDLRHAHPRQLPQTSNYWLNAFLRVLPTLLLNRLVKVATGRGPRQTRHSEHPLAYQAHIRQEFQQRRSALFYDKSAMGPFQDFLESVARPGGRPTGAAVPAFSFVTQTASRVSGSSIEAFLAPQFACCSAHFLQSGCGTRVS